MRKKHGILVPNVLACLACILGASASLAKEPPLTIRKSPFSSSTYRIWKEPRRGPTPRSVERVIKRNPPVGTHSRTLEQQGGHFTSEQKAPYIKPGASRTR